MHLSLKFGNPPGTQEAPASPSAVSPAPVPAPKKVYGATILCRSAVQDNITCSFIPALNNWDCNLDESYGKKQKTMQQFPNPKQMQEMGWTVEKACKTIGASMFLSKDVMGGQAWTRHVSVDVDTIVEPYEIITSYDATPETPTPAPAPSDPNQKYRATVTCNTPYSGDFVFCSWLPDKEKWSCNLGSQVSGGIRETSEPPSPKVMKDMGLTVTKACEMIGSTISFEGEGIFGVGGAWDAAERGDANKAIEIFAVSSARRHRS